MATTTTMEATRLTVQMNAGETYEADLRYEEEDRKEDDYQSCSSTNYDEVTIDSQEEIISLEEEEELIEEEEAINSVEDENYDLNNDDDGHSSSNDSSVWDGDLSTPIIINPADIPEEERDCINTLIICDKDDDLTETERYQFHFPTSGGPKMFITPTDIMMMNNNTNTNNSAPLEEQEELEEETKANKKSKNSKKKRDSAKQKSSKKKILSEDLADEDSSSPNPALSKDGKSSKRNSMKKKSLEKDVVEKVLKRKSSKKKLMKDDDDEFTSPKHKRSSKIKNLRTPKSSKSTTKSKFKKISIPTKEEEEEEDERDNISPLHIHSAPTTTTTRMSLLDTLGGSSSCFPLLDLLENAEEEELGDNSILDGHKSLSHLDDQKKKRKSKRRSSRRISLSEKGEDKEKTKAHSSKKNSSNTETRLSSVKKKETAENEAAVVVEQAPTCPLIPEEFPSLGELLSSQDATSSSMLNPPSMTSLSASQDSRSFHSGPTLPSVGSEELQDHVSHNQEDQQHHEDQPEDMSGTGTNTTRLKKMFPRRSSYMNHNTPIEEEEVDEGETSLLGGLRNTAKQSQRSTRSSFILKKKLGSLRNLMTSSQYQGMEGDNASLASDEK